MRNRYLGNCLGEMDRFLHALVDEMRGVPSPVFQHNAANKVLVAADGRWDAAGDHRRLRALGRTRACLVHCAGVVSRPDERGGGRMTAGWRSPQSRELQTFPLGARLQPAGAELADVAAFYRRLADRLVQS